MSVLKCVVHIDKKTKIESVLSITYGCLSCARSLRSLITDGTERLSIIRTLDISFSA